MSRKKKAHKVKVRKYNRTGRRMWWAECSCGNYQGWHHKQDAREWADRHSAKTGCLASP